MTVTLYSQDNCQPCKATKRALEKSQVPYVEKNISQDEAARRALVDAGFRSAPVVTVERPNYETESWSGFDPARIQILALAIRAA